MATHRVISKGLSSNALTDRVVDFGYSDMSGPDRSLGLTVPGMVAGSPGMEQGGKHDPYKVLFIKKDGSTTEVFSNH